MLHEARLHLAMEMLGDIDKARWISTNFDETLEQPVSALPNLLVNGSGMLLA